MKTQLKTIWFKNTIYILLVFVIITIIVVNGKVGLFYDEIILAANNFLIFIIPAIIMDIFYSNRQIFSIGLNFDKYALRDILYGATMGILGITIISLAAMILGAKTIFSDTDTYKLLSKTFWIFNDATTEELIFRGFVFQNLFRKNNSNTVIIASSLLFATVHFGAMPFDLILFINIFLAGILLCAMYVKTKSLWLSISFHCFWNFTMFVLLNKVYAIDTALKFSADTSFTYIYFDKNLFVYNLLFGSSNGFEAGIICSLMMLFFIFYVLKYVKPSYRINALGFKNEYININKQ